MTATVGLLVSLYPGWCYLCGGRRKPIPSSYKGISAARQERSASHPLAPVSVCDAIAMTPKQKPPHRHIAHGVKIVVSVILLFSGAAVAQLPPPPIRVVPNPSSSLVLPAPARSTVSPTSPTLSTVTGCCYENRHARRHQIRKSHTHHHPPKYSADTQERIAEMQRRAAVRAEIALESVIGDTGGRAKRKQSRAKPKTRQ